MHILILGAGYAGLRAALELGRLPAERRAPLQVTLVDRNPYHQVVQLLHQTAASANPPAEATIPLRGVFPQGGVVRLVEAEVAGLDIAARQVLTADGPLPYDRLVVALGSQPDYRGVPGAQRHALPLRSHADATGLREHIVGCFGRAAAEPEPGRRRALLTFAVAGGGYTGCQVAGELAAWLPDLCRAHGLAPGEARLALLQAGELLLEQFGPWATDQARQVLTGRGVSVHLRTPVVEVAPEVVTLGGAAAGKVLRAATLVWAAGWRTPRLLPDAGLPTDERGCAHVDGRLRVAGRDDLYACGDCARVLDGRGGVLPATASYAMRQGEYLAGALAALAHGETPAPYAPRILGQVVSLGPGEAIGDPLGIRLSGLPAALLKKGIEQWYLSTVPRSLRSH